MAKILKALTYISTNLKLVYVEYASACDFYHFKQNHRLKSTLHLIIINYLYRTLPVLYPCFLHVIPALYSYQIAPKTLVFPYQIPVYTSIPIN
jgi:hypothetical protein